MSGYKRSDNFISNWVGLEQTDWIRARGSDQSEQSRKKEEFVIAKLSRRFQRYEEESRGGMMRRKREREGGGVMNI